MINKVKYLILQLLPNYEKQNFIWQKETKSSYTDIVWCEYSYKTKTTLDDLFQILHGKEKISRVNQITINS